MFQQIAFLFVAGSRGKRSGFLRQAQRPRPLRVPVVSAEGDANAESESGESQEGDGEESESGASANSVGVSGESGNDSRPSALPQQAQKRQKVGAASHSLTASQPCVLLPAAHVQPYVASPHMAWTPVLMIAPMPAVSIQRRDPIEEELARLQAEEAGYRAAEKKRAELREIEIARLRALQHHRSQ